MTETDSVYPMNNIPFQPFTRPQSGPCSFMSRLLLLIAVLAIGLTGHLYAQTLPIAEGDRLRVRFEVEEGRQRITGTFLREAAGNIWIQTGPSPQSIVRIPALHVLEVERSLGRRHYARRGSWIAGTLIGVPVGTFVFFRQRHLNGQCRPELSLPGECEANYNNPAKLGLLAGTVAGLGAAPWGAFIGWLIRTERWAPVDIDLAVVPSLSEGMVTLRWQFGTPQTR